MKSKIISPALTALLSLTAVVLPAVAQAQGVFFANPLTKKGEPLSLVQVVAQITRGVLGVAAVLAVIFALIGGFRIIFAAGNEDQVTQGKQALLWAILGVLVSFGGFIVLSALIQRLPLLLGQSA